MSKQICFILDWYPTLTNNGCIFAKHLICAIADQGFDCVVIAPRIKNAHTENVPYERNDKTENGSPIRIFTPTYLHLSSRKQTMKLSMNNHFKAVMKVIKKENLHPDVIYGHFIYQCGLTAARVGEEMNVPSYCACGENSLRFMPGSEPYTTGIKFAGWKDILCRLTGIISVSSYNKELLLSNDYYQNADQIGVFPNGFDSKKFYPMDKTKARQDFGFPEDAFIVAFTGAFSERKGINKLNHALKSCGDVLDGINKYWQRLAVIMVIAFICEYEKSVKFAIRVLAVTAIMCAASCLIMTENVSQRLTLESGAEISTNDIGAIMAFLLLTF